MDPYFWMHKVMRVSVTVNDHFSIKFNLNELWLSSFVCEMFGNRKHHGQICSALYIYIVVTRQLVTFDLVPNQLHLCV